MPSPLDDLPTHESSAVTDQGGGHPDFIESYEHVVFDRQAGSIVGARLTVHPNRRIIDASFSVVTDGCQRSLHASKRYDAIERRTEVGPIALSIVEPMAAWRFTVDAAELGFGAELLMGSVGQPSEHQAGAATRVYQRLATEVSCDIDGREVIVGADLPGFRTRRWGVSSRDGAATYGAPALDLPQFFRYELLLIDGDDVTVASADLDDEGVMRECYAAKNGAELGHRPLLHPDWQPGTRWCSGGHIELTDEPALPFATMTRLLRRGLGDASSDWSAGAWHDELAVGTESWMIDDLEPTDVHNLRAAHLIELTDGSDAFGLLDVVAVGPCEPALLTGFTDGYVDRG